MQRTHHLLKNKILKNKLFSAMFAHGNAFLQLFLVMWIFLRSLSVICYSRWVLRVRVTKITSSILVSHELTAYLSIFNLSKLWPYYQKHVNQIILNYTIFYISLQISETFVQILLIMNLSLNQTLLTFLLCVWD